MKIDIERDPLAYAIAVAATAHAGQVDKGGQPYILHPLRVMADVVGLNERIVAVLHDVIEDSDTYSLDQAQVDFGIEVAMALDAITKRKGETYDAYLGRVAANKLATTVKLADMRDNSDLSRLGGLPTKSDWERLEKYQVATARLGGPLGAPCVSLVRYPTA